MQSFIPDSVSTEQLKALSSKHELPEWDGSLDTAFDIGLEIIDAIPVEMYQTPGHVMSLALKSLMNLEGNLSHLADHFAEEDPDLTKELRRREAVIHSLVRTLIAECCHD